MVYHESIKPIVPSTLGSATQCYQSIDFCCFFLGLDKISSFKGYWNAGMVSNNQLDQVVILYRKYYTGIGSED